MNILSKNISRISVRPVLFQKGSFTLHNHDSLCRVVEHPKLKYYEGDFRHNNNNNQASSCSVVEYPKCFTCKHFTSCGKCELYWWYEDDLNNIKIYHNHNAIDINLNMICKGILYEHK